MVVMLYSMGYIVKACSLPYLCQQFLEVDGFVEFGEQQFHNL